MQKGTLKLYGEIWAWGENSFQNFSSRLNELDKQGFDVIDLHIHCKGGDVLEGIAICNAIRDAKTPVDAYIDGVAASMATVVMLPCRKVYQAQNAFLMIHAPSGGTNGTASSLEKSAKMLRSIEKNFKRVYSKKTGKTEQEVSEWLDGGDNWFSAEEALRERLIDGIYDSVDADTSILKREEAQNYTPTMMYQRYVALSTNTNDSNNAGSDGKEAAQTNPNIKNMDKKAIIARYGLTSVTEESTEDQIYAAIDAKIASVNEAKTNAEAKLQQEKDAQIESVVAAAVTAKKIEEAQKADFVAIGKSAGMPALQTALAAIKPYNPITNNLSSGNSDGGANSNNEPKSFTELVALGEAALTAWRKDRPQDYARLYKAEFGHDLKVQG